MDSAQSQGRKINLVESFTARRKADIWNDCVIVFRKGRRNLKPLPNGRILYQFPPPFYNVRFNGEDWV